MANEDTLRRVDQQLSNRDSVETGQVTVGTAGTAEPLSDTSIAIPDGTPVAVRADGDNSTPVYLGDSTVTTTDGVELTAGDGVNINVTDVSKLYVDAETAGDGVSWIVEVDA